MAINNTVVKGTLSSPTSFGGVSASTPSVLPAQLTPKPVSQSSPMPGLVSPSHPAAGSLGKSPVVSHTITTNPDGSTTTKVTHANDSATSKPNTSSTSQPSQGGVLVAPGYNASNLPPGALSSPNQPTQPATQPNTPATPTQQPATFPGLVNSLANFQTPASAQGLQQSGQAFGQTQGFINDLTQNRLAQAEALKISGGQPMPIGELLGRQGLLNNFYAQQQAALGAGAQAASNLYSPGLNAAVTGQGQQQAALASAANLAQPSPTAYGQTVFNPLEGQFAGGGGLPPETMAQYAQMAANGQYSAIPTSITSNPVLSAQLNAAAKAINPNFNPIASTAQGASTADLTNQASSIQAQANGAEANFNLMLDIARQGGVNDSNVPILNTLQQNVSRGLTSSAAVANFQSLVQSVRSQYASILGGGTVTVEALQEAQTLIPNDISISALQSLGENLKKDAANRVTGINQQISSLAGGQPQSGSSTSSGTGTITWDNIGD